MADIKLDPMEMLLRLTEQLTETRGRVKTLEDQELAATLDSLDTNVGRLRETLAAVTEAVEQMRAEPEEETEEEPDWPGHTPNWTDDLDQKQARELWDGLTEWAQNKLWPIYAQSVWKPCWYRHPQVRIELTALWRNYEWSYEKGKGVSPNRVMEWHARWWPHVERVMTEQLKDCGLPREDLKNPKHPVPVPTAPTKAEPKPPPPAFHITDFVDPRFLDIVDKDVERRREPDEEDDSAD